MTSHVLALIPAKHQSVGVPGKNWKPITPDGRSCVALAVSLADSLCLPIVVSVERPERLPAHVMVARRPPDLPDTMLAVVQHALEAVPGPDDEIIVLLQPSSPLRTAETVTQAIWMLEGSDASSVVSVSESYPVEWSLLIDYDRLEACDLSRGIEYGDLPTRPIEQVPSRRQECRKTFKRDGVVYAFYRKNLRDYGNIYGPWPRPLYTPPAEALSIDTQADWDEAVRRLVSHSSDVRA